ncbi:MAG: hypothetical protein K9J79_10430 [Desulfobacteraceae bacterium]|nr:hypothetical protein [Desulfobacteraceae bacterium]
MRKALSILVAAFFLLGCYAPVLAAEFDLYGSARVGTFWTDYDSDYYDDDLADTTQLNYDLQGNSRIGATLQSGPIGGAFEYGASGGNANIRKLYGTFDFGPGQLLIGQDYTPFSVGNYISGQVYGVDSGMGEFMGDLARAPMVQYSGDSFSVALVEVNTDLFEISNQVPGSSSLGTEYTLPKIEARYHTMFNDIGFNVSGVFQTYDLKGNQTWDGETVNSWAVAATARFNMLDPVYLNAGGYLGQNVNNLGVFYEDRIKSRAELNAALEAIEDTTTYSLLFVAGTNVNDIGLEAGAGYLESDNDNWAEKWELMACYAQARIPMLEGGNAYIIPEVGYYDWDDNTGQTFDELYAGLQWRVDF